MLAGEKREYGHAQVKIEKHKGEAVHVDKLFNGLGSELEVYMSHGKRGTTRDLERRLICEFHQVTSFHIFLSPFPSLQIHPTLLSPPLSMIRNLSTVFSKLSS